MLASDGRVVMISGANRGIGRAVAERLRDEGYALSLGARDPSTLTALINTLPANRALAHAFDARERASAVRWAAATRARFGRIDALVNNAGVMLGFDIDESDETALDEMWEVNVKGPLRLTRAVWADLERCGHGRVINIVSLSGKRVKSARAGAYAMSKHALAALGQTLRHAGWEHGIRATNICPGLVTTSMTEAVTEVAPEDMTPPPAVAHLVASVLALPNNASVAEIPVNCVLEHSV